ncbi:MAG: hypothetical protein ACFBWO_02030 [Paracoccaceae bacterium]
MMHLVRTPTVVRPAKALIVALAIMFAVKAGIDRALPATMLPAHEPFAASVSAPR